jgi:nicotinate-nucleotide adenylyltransferase
MPTHRPPHKQQTGGASPERRRDMVQLAIEGVPYFRLEPTELDRGGTSYAIDTAELLSRLFPDKSFFWIIGGDMACYLPQWYRILDLVRIVTFVALNRPGYTTDLTLLPASIRERVQLFEMVALDVSSTIIRQRLRQGKTVRFLLPDQVLAYIYHQEIYSGV